MAAHYAGDTSVNGGKILHYFQLRVFDSTVKKRIKSNIGYVGAVGVSSRLVSQFGQQETDSSAVDPFEWQASDALATAAVKLGEDEENETGESADDESEDENGACENSDNEGEDRSQRVNVQSKESARNPRPQVVANAAERTQVLDMATVDKFDRKVIYTPMCAGTAKNIKKAFIYLWLEQRASNIPYPNQAPHPGTDRALTKAIEQYTKSLVIERAITGTTRSSTCAGRDAYSEKQLLRMSSYLWRELPLPQQKGNRRYNARNRFQYMRERFCLLARHHMLLRDQDLRGLNISDLFNIQQRHPAKGSSLASGLVFCISHGKTNPNGVNVYATAFRHKNFLRCTVGAFAFYMLERFE
ncbi:hypothetical protein BGW38_008553, partial [Lunasporangiospora selenospora]